MIKYSKKTALIGTSLSIAALCVIGSSFYMTSPEPQSSITFKDFQAGTQIDYQVSVDGNVVQNGYKLVRSNQNVKLPMPLNVAEGKNVTYDLNLNTTDNQDEDIKLSFDVLADHSGLNIQGSGLQEFSKVSLKHSDGKEENITSDWSGMFVSEIRSSGVNEDIADDKTIELALNNVGGVVNDAQQYAPGTVEVFFGEGSGSNRTRVQQRYSWALIRMTEELSAVMAAQTHAVGMFFDASIQLDAQRKMQELHARAHKDYHPSEQMCRIGSFIKSVAHTETYSETSKHALNRFLMNQYLAVEDSAADGGPQIYQDAKQEQYIDHYCDRRDNNNAAESLCPITGTNLTQAQRDRLNKDVDYVRTLAGKLTVDVDYNDRSGASNANVVTEDEEDIMALAKHLYFPKSFQSSSHNILKSDMRPHFDARSYAAKMNIAHSSFLNIVGMKSSAPEGQATTATATAPAIPPQMRNPRNPAPQVLTEDAGWAYMKALLREFGITDTNGNADITDEIEEILGERPSYYAQMEILTKKIYQHPNFYTNLYDKPANVKRIGAAIDAITLMHQRDRFDSMLRSEMLTSVLVEEELQPHTRQLNAIIYEGMQQSQTP